MITRELTREGAHILNYLDVFGAVAVDEATAIVILTPPELLARLGIQEAKHKANSPSQVLDWLGLHFTSRDMTISLTIEKLTEVRTLVTASLPSSQPPSTSWGIF